MNDERRKAIAAAREKIGEAVTLLEIARDEETDYKENMPEGIAAGEKGDRADEAIEKLEEVLEALESADGILEEVVSA